MKMPEESFWRPIIEKAEGNVNDVWYAGMNKDRALKLAYQYLEDSSDNQSRIQRLKSRVNRLDAFYRASENDPDPRLKYSDPIPESKPYFRPLQDLFGEYHLVYHNWWDGYFNVIIAKNILHTCEMKDKDIDDFNAAFDISLNDVLQESGKGIPRIIKRLAHGYSLYIQQINEAFPL